MDPDLIIDGRRTNDPALIDAARVVLAAFEDETEEDDGTEPTLVVGHQGHLVVLATWSAWRARLAAEIAIACGCVAYVDDEGAEDGAGSPITLVGTTEDAKAARLAFRNLERHCKKACVEACAEEGPLVRARWLDEYLDRLTDRLHDVCDASLDRAYRQRPVSGLTVVVDEEWEVDERVEAARAWLEEHLDCDELSVMPDLPRRVPDGVVDMAAFALRRRTGT